MIWLPPLACLAASMLASALALCPACLPHAAPLPLPAAAWRPLGAAAAVVLLLIAAAAARARRRELWELLLIYPPLCAVLAVAAPDGRPGPASLAAAAALAAAAGWLMWRDRRRDDAPAASPSSAARRFRAALRPLAPPTLALMAAAAAAGAAAGHKADGSAVLRGALTYPLYALPQLLLFLLLPWRRLRLLAHRRRDAALAVSMLFALAHWPNGSLMAACFLGMLLWSAVYARRPSLPAVAVSMGLTAAAAAQLLPDAWTEHLWVGARCVRERTATALAGGGADPIAPPTFAGADAFVAALYPGVVGRPATDGERAAWRATLAEAQRRRLATSFLTSGERRERLDPDAPRPGTDPAAWNQAQQARLRELAAPAYLERAGGDFAGLLRAYYREVLAREPAPAELDAWPADPPLTLAQRRRLAVLLLDRRRDLARAPFAGLEAERLRLP